MNVSPDFGPSEADFGTLMLNRVPLMLSWTFKKELTKGVKRSAYPCHAILFGANVRYRQVSNPNRDNILLSSVV